MRIMLFVSIFGLKSTTATSSCSASMPNMQKYAASELVNGTTVTTLYVCIGAWMTDSVHENKWEEILTPIYCTDNNNCVHAFSVAAIDKTIKF